MSKYYYLIEGNTYYELPVTLGVSNKTKKELTELFKERGYKWDSSEKVFLDDKSKSYISIRRLKFEDF